MTETVPPSWLPPSRRPPPADVAYRGADMCRQAIGLPPRHTLPVEEPEDDHEQPERA